MTDKDYKSVYELYLDECKKFAEENKDCIRAANEEIPQHILWAKTVSEHLEDETAKFKHIDGKFYFTETLVNKLMYFAYLKGAKAMDETSYRRGWYDRGLEIARHLGYGDNSEEK